MGLAAALRLAEAGVRVTLIEQEPKLGGLAVGFETVPGSDVTLEKFYHHWFTSDHHIMSLVQSLGHEHLARGR